MAQSLFGLTPEQIQEARRMQQQQAINQQAQSFGMFGPLYAAGRGMAQQGIGALAQGLFPDAGQDPMLQRATTTQSIIEKYKGQDFNNPLVLTRMASEFSEAGQPDIAMQLGEEARKRVPKEGASPFAKLDPSKYTPESIRAFQAQGGSDFSLLREAESKDKASPERVRETRIGELVQRGYPSDYASDIVDGNIRYEVVPQTGAVRRIDRLTGNVNEVPISNLPPQVQADLIAADEENQNQTLWEAAENGTGLWSAVRAGASRIVGQVPGVPQAQKTEEARQLLSTATNDLARALVINPRFPVAEVERIIREAGTQPGAFDTPELMRSRLKVLDSFLKDRLSIAKQDADNVNLPQETRSAQASNASAIRSFLPRLGIPQQGIGKPPAGVTQRQWEAMTPAQRAVFR